MQVISRFLLAVGLLFMLGLSLAEAQETSAQPEKREVVIDKRKLLVQPRNADGSVIATRFMEDPVMWLREQQRRFYGQMASSIHRLKSSSATSATWTLVTISFLYGIFHAAGPGHGKAVVTGWVLATERELKRGILIAFLSALFQAFTAIIAVTAILMLVKGGAAMAKDAAGYLESASYLMIAAMGAYLVWNGWTSHKPKPVASVATAGPFQLVSRPDSGLPLHHVHGADCGCGHAHAPSAAEVKGDWSWSRAVAMALAVGIRPCSGAILVLVASYALGLYWAGILSTLAMGMGVFLTIAIIASLAVYAKGVAVRLTGTDNLWTVLALRYGKVAMGVLIAGFGLLLFTASLGSTNLAM